MRQRLEAKGTSVCELAVTCPYYVRLFDMPDEYRQQCCRGEFQQCGRYLVYVAVESERQTRFGGRSQQNEG